LGGVTLGVENPATEEIVAEVTLGSVADVDLAVAAARAAFPGYTTTPITERIALLQRILEVYIARENDFVEAMSTEMGAPLSWAREAQFWAGRAHIESTIEAAEQFHWEEMRGSTRIVREGIGVCCLITPWNWPMNQIACKVAPAIAAGCTITAKSTKASDH
jgi:aldehyde dehydrogenase (NAD+)